MKATTAVLSPFNGIINLPSTPLQSRLLEHGAIENLHEGPSVPVLTLLATSNHIGF